MDQDYVYVSRSSEEAGRLESSVKLFEEHFNLIMKGNTLLVSRGFEEVVVISPNNIYDSVENLEAKSNEARIASSNPTGARAQVGDDTYVVYYKSQKGR